MGLKDKKKDEQANGGGKDDQKKNDKDGKGKDDKDKNKDDKKKDNKDDLAKKDDEKKKDDGDGNGKGDAKKDEKGGGKGAAGAAGKGSDEKKDNTVADLKMDVWGHLPPSRRKEMDAFNRERMMPRYEELLRQYYRNIAENGRRKEGE